MKTLYKTPRLAFASLFFPLFFMLTGCGTTNLGRLATPSGRPEIIIPNSNIQTVMDGVASWLASQGKPIDATGVYTISTTLIRTSLGLLAIKSYYEVVYTIVQNGADVEIYEKTTASNGSDLNGQSDYEDMQKDLAQIAEFMKGRQ